MNIFMTDPCPRQCAIALDNKRLVKMVLETAQLLSTACTALKVPMLDGVPPYAPNHFNHPCSLFARRSYENFLWLTEHGIYLSEEFAIRFGHEHSCEDMINACFQSLRQAVREGIGYTVGWKTEFDLSFNCSGYRTGDLYIDYQHCMANKWDTDKKRPKWSARRRPSWYTSER
jgi:Pyrimidine dimer DNA glycosylase